MNKNKMMKMENHIVYSIVFSLILVVFATPVYALINPAVAYCIELGYEYRDGLCILPDEQQVDSWQFLQGKVAQEHSYCRRQGYELKIVKSSDICITFLLDECAVCVLEDGKEVEVTELMGLSFEETTCGDGTCGMPENSKTCPSDCPSGGFDGFCDGVRDGKCDPDCEELNEADPDCEIEEPEGFPTQYRIIGIIVGIILLITVLMILKKRK